MIQQTAFMTAADAAAYLGVRRDKIYELCRQRRIPSIKLGHRTLRIPRDGFLKAIDKGEIFEGPYGLERGWATDETADNRRVPTDARSRP